MAITGPEPGTTRDRAYAESAWGDKKFILVDTGGLARAKKDPLETSIKKQAMVAVLESDLILFVADGKAPVVAAKNALKEIKETLRAQKVPDKSHFILVVNKIDSPKGALEAEREFARLGLGQPVAVSAISGRGTGDLMDSISSKIEKVIALEEENDIFATVAIVGKPNVGKSTLINHLAGEERVVVSPVPGTTRNAVDIDIEYKGEILRFIDTAGIRRRSKIDIDVEEYALFQATKSTRNADVVVLILEAQKTPSALERTIAGELKENIKGIVVALNKIDDLVSDEINDAKSAFIAYFPFLRFVTVIPISAKEGTNVDRLLDAIMASKKSRDKKIDENVLSKTFKSWIKKNPPKQLRDQKKPVIYGIKQIAGRAPTFELVVKEPPTIHYSYVRYLENQIRDHFDFGGTAIKIRVRKPEK